MKGYNIIQWFTFFVVYCFLGWCIESLIVSVSKKRPVNRGFLRGPVLPLYGSGAVIMLLCTIGVSENPVLVYLLGLLGATLLELVTGASMESMFKMRYWDYSCNKFNFKGYICLKSSLFWGVLTVLLVYFIHPIVSKGVIGINQDVLGVTAVAVFTMMAADTMTAFKGAFDLQKFLDNQTRIRQEKDEIDRLGKLKYSIISGFPSATSKKFHSALEDVKEKIRNKV